MSDASTKRARAGFFIGWIPTWALTALILTIRGLPLTGAVLVTLPLTGIYALVCGSSFYMAKALPLKKSHLLQVLSSLFSASLAASGFWVLTAWALSAALPHELGPKLRNELVVIFGLGNAYFVLSLVFHYLILTMEAHREAERRAAEEAVNTREAELRALRAQINPHFLFNSLNSIAALTAMDPDEARRMCLLLSGFLRETMNMGDEKDVPLKRELELIESFLEIEEVRFGERLKVEKEIEKEVLTLRVPPLIFQPLVENAVKHGVASTTEAGVLSLAVKKKGDRIELSLQNPYDPHGNRSRGTGRGLPITAQRLEAFYRGQAQIKVEKGDGTFKVTVSIPVREARDKAKVNGEVNAKVNAKVNAEVNAEVNAKVNATRDHEP